MSKSRLGSTFSSPTANADDGQLGLIIEVEVEKLSGV
jgi:hypothetical protein